MQFYPVFVFQSLQDSGKQVFPYPMPLLRTESGGNVRVILMSEADIIAAGRRIRTALGII